ncbi:MAG TPA: site-2 protease family protein [Trueperaceae bacterium]|nr:site-2 protease family protein [Trueperaceae bacterium]
MLIQLLQTSPLLFAMVAGVLLFSLTLHELAHAVVAEWVGDDTARNLGRITLNPLKHLDPMGALLLLFVGFGWAKPVPINPSKFRNYRSGLFFVSIAGVVVNFLIATIALLILAYIGISLSPIGQLGLSSNSIANNLINTSYGGQLISGLFMIAQINIILAVFNMIPIPPLDGSKVLLSLVPSLDSVFRQIQKYGFLIVIVLINLDSRSLNLLNKVTTSISGFILNLV